ncbi:MAG: response regulator [Lachnospiraceae bacterium]|nr:response regulator [Lachnospiraceae bacterium]
MEKLMRRLLIVEDEVRIGQLIRKLIHFDELQLVCDGIAGNGKDAYDMIMASQPDIVITDIRMPKINGLDLIGMVRSKYPDIRFIVMSGYKEFEYAHRALQYDVDGYILKPINGNELNEALRRIVGTLDDKKREVSEKQKLEMDVKKSRQIIRRDFLRNIIEQEESGELEELTGDGSFPVELTGELFRGIDIKLDSQHPEESSRKEEQQIAARIISIVEKSLGGCAQEVLCCEKEALHIYCLFNYHAEHSREIRTAVSEILSQIKEYLLRFEQYEATIGIGMEKEHFSETRVSIREANRAVGNRISLGSGRLIYADVLKDLPPYVSPVRGAVQELQNIMEARRPDEASRMVRQLFDDYAEQKRDPSGFYEIAYELLGFLYDWMEIEAGEMASNRRRTWIRCQHFNRVKALRDYLAGEYSRCLTIMQEAAKSESTKPVRVAKAYMDEHYGEKIVLEDLAALADLNPVYFSVLFKKETQMNVSSYLKKVRMDRAKELLRTTNETIAAIGDRVGYRDSRHFSQSFTKYVGVKPALYRRLHS